jgi:CheY-like chemotaxis protein
MEAVGRLTGGVAHDFNNLLTVIMQALDLMSSATAEGSANLRLIGNAQRAAARGALLTQQLLAFSRNQPLKPQLHDVAALIRSFVPVLQGGAGEMIELQVDSAANLGSIHVDTAQFEASLLSLVMNARDAMPHGGRIRIHVERASFSQRSSAASPELAAGSYALISVADTGGGIAPECIEHVFEPFYTTKEIGKGSGLGLSQVYGFAAQSEGGVYIASEMGSGTEVTLFLPIASDAPDAAAKPETNVRPVLGVVLLVEDDDSVRQSTVDALELLGYEVVTAAYGAQALDILRRDNRIDILFSDIVMPHGMSGVELAREAHASFPSLRILLASGHPRNAFSDSGDSTEFAFLAKPYRLQELARRLQALTPPG